MFRGYPGRDERPGSAETRGRGNIWPKGGDISVGPYSSTAPPVMRSVADLIADARPAVMSASSRRSDRSIAAPEKPSIIITLRQGTPNLGVLGSQAWRFACKRIEFLLEALVGGFAGVDRAQRTRSFRHEAVPA